MLIKNSGIRLLWYIQMILSVLLFACSESEQQKKSETNKSSKIDDTTHTKVIIPSDSIYQIVKPSVLIDQDGNYISAENLMGKIVLINFIFTNCPSVCPLQTRMLKTLQEGLSDELISHYHQLSVSIDPQRDTVDKLKAYTLEHNLDMSAWSFARGEKEVVKFIIEQLRLFDPNKENPSVDDHSTELWLINIDGKIMQRYKGNPPDIDRISRDIKSLFSLMSS